jgi:RNA polymerase-binding transcription factor DksA
MELVAWRQRLIDLRRKLVDDAARLAEDSFSQETCAGDPTSVAQPQEVALAALEDEREMLRLIDHALAKIDGKVMTPFGICEQTGGRIESDRLELMPWTTVSVKGAVEPSPVSPEPKGSIVGKAGLGTFVSGANPPGPL